MDTIAQKKPFRFTGRLGAYSAAFLVLFTVVTILAATTGSIDTTILRTTGSLYETTTDGMIRNLYTVKILNKTGDEQEYTLRLAQPKGRLKIVGPELEAGPRSGTESVFTVEIAPDVLFSQNTLLKIEVLEKTDGHDGDARRDSEEEKDHHNHKVVDEVTTTFNGPERSWKK